MEVIQILPAALPPFPLLHRSVRPLSCLPKIATSHEHLLNQHLAPSICVLLQYLILEVSFRSPAGRAACLLIVMICCVMIIQLTSANELERAIAMVTSDLARWRTNILPTGFDRMRTSTSVMSNTMMPRQMYSNDSMLKAIKASPNVPENSGRNGGIAYL